MAIALAYAGLEMGVDVFDACVDGLGGCPFAAHKGAAGNIMCEEMGVSTAIGLGLMIAAAKLAEDIVGHPLPGSIMRGGALNPLREKARAAA